MRKVYEAPGMMEWHPVIIAGKSRVRVSFEGGYFSGRGHTPASYETADGVVQAMIENSSQFKTGRIRLAAGFKKGIQAKAALRSPAVSESRDQMTEFEFPDLIQAQDYLVMEKNVARTEVLTAEDCVREGARRGIKITIKS